MPTTTIRTYDYATWYADTKRAGGVPVSWPFSSGMYAQYYGRPAAKFSAVGYSQAANAGAIVASTPTQTDGKSTVVYVLAPSSAWKGAPQTMGKGQSFLNALFTTGDRAADAAGLPSLVSVENFLKSLGKDALLIVAVGGVAWYLLNRKR